MVQPLYELVYISAAVAPFGVHELRALLQAARLKNRRLGVTGMLLHAQGSFLQVLEGPEEAVRGLFDVITRDPRHKKVLRVFSGPSAARGFGEWTMGFADASFELSHMPGFNDFLRTGFADTHYTEALQTKVRDLAQQFRIGRWRQYIAGA